jgi:hypothetical protein
LLVVEASSPSAPPYQILPAPRCARGRAGLRGTLNRGTCGRCCRGVQHWMELFIRHHRRHGLPGQTACCGPAESHREKTCFVGIFTRPGQQGVDAWHLVTGNQVPAIYSPSVLKIMPQCGSCIAHLRLYSSTCSWLYSRSKLTIMPYARHCCSSPLVEKIHHIVRHAGTDFLITTPASHGLTLA